MKKGSYAEPIWSDRAVTPSLQDWGMPLMMQGGVLVGDLPGTSKPAVALTHLLNVPLTQNVFNILQGHL